MCSVEIILQSLARAATARVLAVVCLLGAAAPTDAAAYRLPPNGGDVVGAVTPLRLVYEDTLASIARRYGIGYGELLDANPGVDPWLPGDGTRVQLPTAYILPDAPRRGLVINVAEYRIYYYPSNWDAVVTFPVGVGRSEYQTPEMRTSVVTRIENPSWTPTPAARKEHAAIGDILPHVVPPGPDNPLGSMALQLAAPGYFIHGTNKPFGVGQMVSHGCIRLYDEHIETLVEMVANGTPVTIVNQPFKIGWKGDELFVEGHRSLYAAQRQQSLRAMILEATRRRAANVDWQRVDQVQASLLGVPVSVQARPSS